MSMQVVTPARRRGPLPATAALAAALLGGLCLLPAADGRTARTLHEDEAWAVFGGQITASTGCCGPNPKCTTTSPCRDRNQGACSGEDRIAASGVHEVCINSGTPPPNANCAMQVYPPGQEGLCATTATCTYEDEMCQRIVSSMKLVRKDGTCLDGGGCNQP